MKQTLSFFCFVALIMTATASAQVVEVPQGPGYTDAAYLELSTASVTTVPHTAWDIAFTVGGGASGILVNEGVDATTGQELQLFGSTAANFATADTTSRTGRLYNGEVSWNDGAFNAAASPGDPFDLGWGSYDPTTHVVSGTRTFFLAARDGVYHKVFVHSLSNGTYTFVHAPISGGAPDTVRIDKGQFPGKTLAYFSFADGVVDLEPAGWDLLFTRYVTPLDDNQGGMLDYTVTGVLQNQGVSVAQLDGADPATVVAPTADSLYADTLTTIGYDWKTFDMSTFQYSILEDRVYFVRTADSTYRVSFLDFEGSATGVTTLQVHTETTTATASLPKTIRASRLFPNPATDRATLVLDSRTAEPAPRLQLIDATGRTMADYTAPPLAVGTNRLEVPLRGLPAGHYFVRLTGRQSTLTHHLVKR